MDVCFSPVYSPKSLKFYPESPKQTAAKVNKRCIAFPLDKSVRSSWEMSLCAPQGMELHTAPSALNPINSVWSPSSVQKSGFPCSSSLHPPTLQHNRTPLPAPHRWTPDEQAQQCDCEGEWWHFSVHIASMPTSTGRKGKVKLAMWGGGGKPHQRSRVLPQKEIICPRKEWRLYCLSFLRGN